MVSLRVKSVAFDNNILRDLFVLGIGVPGRVGRYLNRSNSKHVNITSVEPRDGNSVTAVLVQSATDRINHLCLAICPITIKELHKHNIPLIASKVRPYSEFQVTIWH